MKKIEIVTWLTQLLNVDPLHLSQVWKTNMKPQGKAKFITWLVDFLSVDSSELMEIWHLDKVCLHSWRSDVFGLDSISKIETGMFWFTDNLFSKTLQPDKKIRAIVLGADEYRVYGWLPEERSLTYFDGQSYQEYQPKILEDNYYFQIIKRMPSVDELLESFSASLILKEAFAKAGMPSFMGNYWAWKKRKPYLLFSPVSGEKMFLFKNSKANIRWIVEARLK